MSTDQRRHNAGTPNGGKFAAAARAAADLDAVDLPLEVPDAVGPVEPAAPHRSDKDSQGRYIDPHMALISMSSDDVSDLDEVRRYLPNVSDGELLSRWSGVLSARMKAERYSDPAEAEEAPSGDQLVELNEFAGSYQDRFDEGDTFGYDFDAYASSLSQAWDDRALEEIKDLMKADAAAATVAVEPVQSHAV